MVGYCRPIAVKFQFSICHHLFLLTNSFIIKTAAVVSIVRGLPDAREIPIASGQLLFGAALIEVACGFTI